MGAENPPYPETDSTYEEERAKAEREYYIASVDWLSDLVEAQKKTPGPPPDFRDHLNKVMAAALMGDPIPEHKLDHEAGLLVQLAWICSGFARAEIRAYAGWLARSNLAMSHKARALEQHGRATINEILARKWNPGVKYMSSRFHGPEHTGDCWRNVIEAVDEEVADLEPAIWFDFQEPPGEVAIPAEPPSERSECLRVFKRRGKEQGISITDQMIAQAASKTWNDRTQVTWWKRYDDRSGDTHDRLIRAVLQKDPATLWPKK